MFQEYASGQDCNVLLFVIVHSVRRGDASGCCLQGCSPPRCLWHCVWAMVLDELHSITQMQSCHYMGGLRS